LNSYLTIDKEGFAEFKDRGSRFLAYAYPISTIDEFKLKLSALKKEHPKAVHHCFAYRLGTDGNNFRVSDDGEPSGTAGRPILGQIDSRILTNVAVIVVRYFGGTLLGVPGLINAYKTATVLALQMVPPVEKAIELLFQVSCSYPQLNEVMTIVKQHHCSISNQETGLFCTLTISIPMIVLAQAMERLQEIYGVELKHLT
jgi:uncharacterized YigZ family protein